MNIYTPENVGQIVPFAQVLNNKITGLPSWDHLINDDHQSNVNSTKTSGTVCTRKCRSIDTFATIQNSEC